MLILVGLGFTVTGIFMIREGERLDGLLVTVFFGLCLAAGLAQLWPGASYLKLTPKGFICRGLFRPWRLIPWESVNRFRAGDIGSGKTVVYDLLAGPRHGLPDTYGLKADELAELMNDWRDRALASSGPSAHPLA